jgi:hypothetical protein
MSAIECRLAMASLVLTLELAWLSTPGARGRVAVETAAANPWDAAVKPALHKCFERIAACQTVDEQ